MAVSDILSNGIETARERPLLAVGAAAGLVGIVWFARRGGSSSSSSDQMELNGTTPFPVDPDAEPGDGFGWDTPEPITKPPTTNVDPIGGTQKPGPILGPSLRITDADRAAYMCDEGKYLRYGKAPGHEGKIVCVDKVTRKEGKVILKQDGARAH